ncbi:hypothetical protein [Pararhizobium antarcticum]|uniref:Transmembrane anchored protein n=1 Tax=Pararhizobium antarcticum TaxID=1798805 RepID=A0A657LTM0_9HYPH|nr:hypothetical protein [Pararhizobium antarcticum]OJF95459.1 hypothetical protein AX761_17800 [Rhizobium sp. 58]OJF97937.1 hypothetical protein AX760_15890 [Pararhizobium antarcticum]
MSVSSPASADDHSPLISPRFLYRVTAVAVALAALTIGISMAGRWFGQNLAQAGHTASTQTTDIFIGQDHLRLPANVIRFEDQRITGTAERTDLYVTWPQLEGYTDGNRHLFNDVDHPENLIFLQISQSTMSRDMSGRLEPIYKHLFEGAPAPGPAGLSRQAMKKKSGYGDEIMFTAEKAGVPPYAVRCILPQSPAFSTSADCQRDIHAGRDLVVLYRFSSQLLPQWQAIDKAIQDFVATRLVTTP